MLMGRAGLSPVMVGRSEELVALLARLDEVAAGGLPPVVVLSGEAGVGKTRLLRELTRAVQANEPPVNVLVGHAEEGRHTRPFGLLGEVLGRAAATWDPLPAALAGRAHALGHVLAPLLPEHPPTSDHEHAIDELVLAAVAAIRHEVGTGPAVLVFEDLHWAGAESIALFGRLATTEDLPVLLIGTLRPEDFDRRHPLARTLPALERQRPVTHVALSRLGRPDLARMLEEALGEPVPAATVDVLHRRTQGNPFFVEELVAAVPGLDAAALAGAPLPWNAAEAVLRRVDDLDALPRRALEAAAVLGGRVPFDRLAAVTGLDEDVLIGVFRDLVDRGLLREEEPDVFSFRHALTREAIAGQLLGREQRRLHRAALAALDAEIAGADGADDVSGPRCTSADLTDVARHAAGAGEWPRLAQAALEGAPRLRREGSARQAQALAELALDRCEDLGDEDAIALAAVAATSAWEGGALETALRHAGSWHRLAVAAGDRRQESAALRLRWRVRYELGDRAGADTDLEAARTAAEALGPSVELAWVHAYVSQRHMLAEEHEETLRWADRALALAAEVDAPEVVPYALVNKGTILAETQGRQDEGVALLEEARSLALVRHDGATAGRALNNAVNHLLQRPDGVERARQLLAEGAELLDRYGQEGYRAYHVSHATNLALIDGDLQAARAALSRIGVVEDVALAGVLLFFRNLLEAEAGDAQRAFAALPGLPDPLVAEEDAWLALARVVLGTRIGRKDEVAAALGAMDGAAGTPEIASALPFTGPTAVLLAAPGEVGDGPLERLLATARAAPTGLRHLGDPGLIAHAEGALLARRGDHEAAVEAYRRAAAPARIRSPLALEVAAAEAGLARSLAALGRREEAAGAAGSAVRRLARWPGWRRDEAELLHRRLTGGDRSEGRRAGEADLTPRELEVLGLVAEGLSNREIGERLYITTKTAAVHVSNILAKVGAASRTEAAAWALRHGVVGPGAAKGRG